MFLSAVAIIDCVEYLLVPTNSAKQLRRKFVFRFDVISKRVCIAHVRNLKTHFIKLGPQLQVMPCEADILSKDKLSIVVDVPTGRQRRFRFTPKIRTLATREAEIPRFVRPESNPAAESRIFEPILGDIPGFGTRGE